MVQLSDTFSFHDFSWRGDPRWADSHKLIVYAPWVVFVLFILSIAEIAFGSTWLVQLNHITLYDCPIKTSVEEIDWQKLMLIYSSPKIIQTLLIPGLSFFNTLPSLHAHLLLRRNPPLLAIWFSSIFTVMMAISPILMLASCVNSPSAGPALRQAECYRGTPGKGGDSGVHLSIWALYVATTLLSAFLYAVHLGMAVYVRRNLKAKAASGADDAIDLEEEERRRAKARELWKKAVSMEGL